MKFNAALTVISLSCLSWQGKTEQADVVLSPPSDAAEESLSHLLGELMANRNHILDVNAAGATGKNATQKQLLLQPEEKDTKQVEDFDKFNRDEQERNCILLGAVGDRIPNSDEICTCSDTTGLDLTCSSMMGMCSGGTNNVCADSTEVYIDLNSGLMIEYRSDFPTDYMDTTITLNLNNEGDRIEDCSATYNGDNCNCYACGDAQSITVDCSAFDCRATTNGCQAVDLTARQLVTVVPDFQPSDWVCPTPAPVAAPTRAPVTPPTTRAPVAPTPVTPQTPTTAATPSRPIPTLPPDADRSCSIFAILGQQLPGADELCYCSSEMVISCIFGATCGDNGLCADFVEIGVDMSAGLPAVNYCIDFVDDSGYETTCIDMGINFDQTISACNAATYGDNECTCTLCEDNVSLDIDCSMHDPGATTNGCQGMPENLGPLIPNFDMRTGYASTGGSDVSTGAVDCTIYPRGEPRPPPDGPTDCFLYTMLQTELPDYAQNCECDGQVALNCYMDHICSDGVCVDQMNAVASLENGNNAETCVIFSDERVEELCVSIAVNLDQTIMGCNYATYGGQDCRCEVCDDQVSMTVDCTEFNEYALAECQGMTGLEPQVIGFRMPPPDDCVEGGSTGSGDTIDSVAADDDDFVAEPWPPEGADQQCQIMSLGTAQMPPGAPPLENFCICESETSLACRFYDTCQGGLCANQVDTGLDIGTGTPRASYCTNFRGGIFEDTCVVLDVDFAMTIQQCVEATYGGLPCECTVCDDQQSMIIDCSMHNPDATTITCQAPPAEIGPIIPQFQHDGASGSGTGSALSDCGLINVLEDRIPDTNPETTCECEGDQRVDCVQEDYCYNSRLTQSATCAETVDFAIDITQGVTVINCATFDDELNGYEFEPTCVEVATDREMKLDECVRVTYGGRPCTCEVCPGNNAIELDCTEHDENAWIPCQPFNVENEFTPFVPHFMGSVDGSNENLQRAGCSGATTAAVSFFTLVAATVLGVCVSVFMI